MDPNVTLAELRRDVDELATLDLSPEEDAVVQAVIGRWRDLDGWLTAGNFRPRAWIPTTVDEVMAELVGDPWRRNVPSEPLDELVDVPGPDPDGGAWSDPAVRDAVARTVEATPDDLLEQLEEHYDEDDYPLVVCARCAANPDFQAALEAFGGTLVGSCGHADEEG